MGKINSGLHPCLFSEGADVWGESRGACGITGAVMEQGWEVSRLGCTGPGCVPAPAGR